MFLVVGAIGAVLLILFLVFDDVLDGLLPDTDWISGPMIGAFLAAFGVVGWTATAGFDAPGWLASIAGVAGGVGLGYVAYLMMKVLVHSPTDATMTPAALVGREGRVITAAGPEQIGEVLVTIGGQALKRSSRLLKPRRLGRYAKRKQSRSAVRLQQRRFAPRVRPRRRRSSRAVRRKRRRWRRRQRPTTSTATPPSSTCSPTCSRNS